MLWGPSSVLSEGGYHSIVFCRAFTALAFGLFEPLYLLLALFAFIYSLQVLLHAVTHGSALHFKDTQRTSHLRQEPTCSMNDVT